MGRSFLVHRPVPAALRALNYTPEVETFREKAGSRTQALGRMLTGLGESYWAVFTRLDCAATCGVELITQTDMFASEPSGRVIRIDSMPKPENHRVRRWQILIAGAGQMAEGNLFGRSIIADDRLAGKYLGPHAVALTFEDEGGDENLWTYAYLNSKIGIQAIKSAAFGTSVPGLRLDLLADLPIPLLDPTTQARVAALVREAVEARERYAEELRAARAVVEALPEMQEALEMCGERRGRCVLWAGELPTLSAWTYASTGGALGHLKNQWPGRLGDVLEEDGLFNGPRFARVSCSPPHGVEFMSQRDVFLIRPIPRRIVNPGFAEHLLFVPEGSLLVGGHGTLGEGEIFGRVVHVSGRLARAAFTQDLLRVQPKAEHSAATYSLLSTLVGFRLLRSTAVGTKILSMRLDLLRALPFPDLSSAQKDLVSERLRIALMSRTESEEKEAEAIRIVEEEVLPEWLA